MGKKILKLLLYLMAVVGVLIWLDSTEGLTEEGALNHFWHCIMGVFCDETDRLFGKETQNKKRKSAESQKKT